MSFITCFRKSDIIAACVQLDIEASDKNTVIQLKNMILNDENYDEQSVKNILELAKQEREEAERLAIAEAQIESERNFELEKLRLSLAAENRNSVDRESSSSGNSRQLPNMKSIMPKFDKNQCDISLFLKLFERQCQRLEISDDQYVTQLLALLPMELVQIILREDRDGTYDYFDVKQILLDRFKLSPEAFRKKFYAHVKKPDQLWKDFQFEISCYLEDFLAGAKIQTFDGLKDFILTDQIKRKVTPEIRQHYLDKWGELFESTPLVKMLDDYDAVRSKSFKVNQNFNKFERRDNPAKPEEKNFRKFTGGSSPKKNVGSSSRETSFVPNRTNPAFERQRDIICFHCRKSGHIRPNCPELLKNNESVNNIVEKFDVDKLVKYKSIAQINGKQQIVLRDTGASFDICPMNFITEKDLTGECVWLQQPLDENPHCLPVGKISIEIAEKGKFETRAAIIPAKLSQGHYILGNGTAELIKKGKGIQVLNAVVTRSATKKLELEKEGANESPSQNHSENNSADMSPEILQISDEKNLELQPVDENAIEVELIKLKKEDIVKAQQECPKLEKIRNSLAGETAGSLKESFVKEKELIFRITKDHLGGTRKQLVIPKKYVEKVLVLCHEGVSAHLGTTKTKDKVLRNFYWPSCFKEIEDFVRTCDPCQKVGKAGEANKKAPLKIVPVITEIFSRINIDFCGPLIESHNSNRYLLTVLCMSSRYPEAIPVKNMTSPTVIEALLQVFSRIGFPKEVQCDLGTSFTSELTSQFFEKFGIKIIHSSVAHPQTNPVERFHRTLKRLLRVLCLEANENWEHHLPGALLALRSIVHQSIGYSPAELVYGRNLRTPEALLKEHWVEPDETSTPVTEYMFSLINRLKKCQEIAVQTMEETRNARKLWYDRGAVKRQFKKGDQVLILSTQKSNKLAANWVGPGIIVNKISETNYVVQLPHRNDKTSIYHINMLKPYYNRMEKLNYITEEVEKNCDSDYEIPSLQEENVSYDFGENVKNNNLMDRISNVQEVELQVQNRRARTNTFPPTKKLREKL